MTFTAYDDGFTTDRDKVRFYIGDSQQNAGPRPDKRNFSDEEIAFLLTVETTVNGAIAAAFEILANEWESFSISEKEGDVSFDAKKKSEDYDKRALKWRQKPNAAVNENSVFGLDFRDVDDGGNELIPPFQRKQIGNEIIDWDVDD